jgi:serine/threonine-protein kinase HipA
MSISKLVVSLQLGTSNKEIGELVSDGNKIYFKYFSEFIASGIQISPFKLPLSTSIQSADILPFDGLFGVFNDSLPDGWGRLLLDRKLLSKGSSLFQITPIDRLAHVGSEGMGALVYKPSYEIENKLVQQLELDAIAKEMNLVLEGSSSDIIEELYQLGGSSGGARPKIMVGYSPEKDHIIYGNHELPIGYEHWIIKFSSSFDRIDSANIEFAYYLMAKEAGIEMAACKLFKSQSGKFFFGTKRFDRIDNNRLHMHSASGLLHDNFRLSTLDYGHLMNIAFQLEKQVDAYDKILRLATFNVFSHNRDDHSKNFSFLMNESGNWQFAPAYDLTFSNSSHGFHSTTVAGESKLPGRKQLLELAKNFSLKRPNILIEEVQFALSKWEHFSKKSDVGKQSGQLIQKTISQLLKS